jgi:hypothetical protein
MLCFSKWPSRASKTRPVKLTSSYSTCGVLFVIILDGMRDTVMKTLVIGAKDHASTWTLIIAARL